MKNFKFLFASLLLSISAIAFTANSAKAQTTTNYIQWVGGTNTDFVIGTTASSALTTDNNWSALLGSPGITCDAFNNKICLTEVTYSGSQPNKTTTVLPEIKAEYDRLAGLNQLSLFVDGYTWTGASGTQYKLRTKS